MDPNKDFIHIDDLFKDLRNGEEQERSGSWLHMKDLLDKEMPMGTTVSGGRSFRRYIIPLLALLFVGSGVTYYELNKTGTGKDQLASGNHNAPVNPSGNDASGNLVAAEGSTNPVSESGYNKGNGSAASASALNAKGNHDQRQATVKGDKATSHAAVVTTPASRSTVAANSDPRNAAKGVTGTTQPASRQTVADINPRNRKTATGQNRRTAAAPDQVVSSNAPAALAGEIIEEQHVIEEIKPLPGSNKNQNTFAANNGAASSDKNKVPVPNSSSNNLKQLAVSLNNNKIVKGPEGTLYKEQRDTFKRIDLVERVVASSNTNGNRSGLKTILDTVAVTRVEKIRYVPLNPMELVALRKLGVEANNRKLVAIANLRERVVSKEVISLVPLNQYKVASRRVDPGKFNQLVQNTSQGISNYFDGSRNFYAALILGGNASFGNPGAFGMQVGIAGLYSLGERLTLAAELKYANHYFSNYTLEDKSVTFENISTQQLSNTQWLFSGTENTRISVYKVNSFGALEMPVTLNYNLGRVSLLAGLNIAYAFPIKWNKESTVNTAAVQQTRDQNQNPFLSSSFQLNEQKDFASRLGLGYVWGVNYDFSRKVSLDVRMTQVLWDNNNGSTDAINRLFRIPTMQFSFGYYFGRKDKVVYIMDRR